MKCLLYMKFIEANHNRIYSEFQHKGRINKCFYCGTEEDIIASHSVSEKRCLNLLTESVEGKKGVYGFKHLRLSYAIHIVLLILSLSGQKKRLHLKVSVKPMIENCLSY